jgi:hypothetical protein
VARYAAGTLPSLGSARAAVQRKERGLMQAIEERHRLAPRQKQHLQKVQAVMQAFCAARLQRTPGLSAAEPGVAAGLVQMLAAGRAASTDTKYYNAFARVQKWADEVGVCAMPMLPFHFMLYLWALFQHSKQAGLARGNIDIACAAVERFHLLAGCTSPTADVGVQEVRKGMTRELGVRGQQAVPLGDEVLQRMHAWWCRQEVSQVMPHFVTLLTVAVMREGVLLWDDVARIEFPDVLLTEQYAHLFVTERKTDAKREGFWVMLPQARRSQVWAAYQLLKQVPDRFASEFRRLSVVQKGAWLIAHPQMSMWENGVGKVALNAVKVTCLLEQYGGAWLPKGAGLGVSYHQFQDWFRAFLLAVGEDPLGYSTHSMRRGGATELRQRDVPEELIAQHGGWK